MPAPVKGMVAKAPHVVSYVQTAAAATAPDAFVFCNPTGSKEYFEIVDVVAVYDVAGGSGAVADVKISASTVALASGTSALTSTFDLTATARTPRHTSLSTTANALIVKPGDSLGVDTGGTLTGLAGLCVNITLRPMRGARRPA